MCLPIEVLAIPELGLIDFEGVFVFADHGAFGATGGEEKEEKRGGGRGKRREEASKMEDGGMWEEDGQRPV
ncbi:hypothetical protein ONZ45_g14053 [Pleurotus djamor]|nr:hypothetical protein ONZ45_g14053 [Pleurotus djamor]